jgi:hypothetical protein
MRIRFLVYSTIAVLLLGCQRDPSGAYLASDQNTMCWLQLVRTPDERLTGQLTISELKSNGTIDRTLTTVTGAVDGENVSLKGGLLSGLALSGTFRGNTLTLTGNQPIPVAFVRTSLAAYQIRRGALNARSHEIIRARSEAQAERHAAFVRVLAQKVEANFLSSIDQTVADMNRFDLAADVHLARFPGVQYKYEGITDKVAGYVEQDRQLDGNASVARGRLFNDALQVSLASDQLHNQAGVLESSVRANAEPIADTTRSLQMRCQNAGSSNDQESCKRLSTAFSIFRQKYDALTSGLAHLEQVYQTEKAKQQRLIQEAQGLR